MTRPSLMMVEISLGRCSTVMSAIGSLFQITMSASLPAAITPTSPSRPTSQALRLVLATIASIAGMPTSLTNNSASLPCQRPWLKAEALPVSLPLITNMPRSRALRTFNGTRRSCGHCALKPTMGALHRGERQGYSQSHVGVHAGSLADMWRVAMEIARRAGGDPGQPGLFGAPELSPALQPARLIVMETAGWAELDAKTREGFDRILAALRDAGVEVLRATDDPLIDAFEHGIAEAKAITTDICDWENRWSFENLVEQYPGKYSDTLYERLQAGRKLSLDDYRLRLLQREEAKNRLAAIAPLADALISLGSPGPAPHGLGSTGDSVFNSPTSILGAPAVNVPMLAIEGMPVGVQIVGQRHTDARTAGIARWLLESVKPVSVE